MTTEQEKELTRLDMVYDAEGKLYTLRVFWRGEIIQVISNPENATTRELQRADEIVQALIKARQV